MLLALCVKAVYLVYKLKKIIYIKIPEINIRGLTELLNSV